MAKPLERRESPDAPTLVAYASQTGFAERLARRTAASLETAGTSVALTSLADLEPDVLATSRRALFVASTAGEGEPPDSALSFIERVMRRRLPLPQLEYGVLALGDRTYSRYCTFGHRLETWLRHQGATPLFDLIEVDDGDEGALRHWQHHLGVLSGARDLPDWETPRYERWRLSERRLLNPQGDGPPCYHIGLQPIERAAVWVAGDVVEIGPRESAEPDARFLPHREYSIASIPADGAIELLVRQVRRPDGRMGVGATWLTLTVPDGGDVWLRVRSNPNFHAPPDGRPLILIGNGTGIAGLRSLLKARVLAGHHRNWLLFGERTAERDYFYGDEIERWRAEGSLERLDLAFSRDRPERLYVQHRLAESADELRRWIADGAALYVCGSLDGMATGVDAVLKQALGAAAVEQLALDGRYRREVY